MESVFHAKQKNHHKKMTPFAGVIFCKRIYEKYFLLLLLLFFALRKTSVLKSFLLMPEIFISRHVT